MSRNSLEEYYYYKVSVDQEYIPEASEQYVHAGTFLNIHIDYLFFFENLVPTSGFCYWSCRSFMAYFLLFCFIGFVVLWGSLMYWMYPPSDTGNRTSYYSTRSAEYDVYMSAN